MADTPSPDFLKNLVKFIVVLAIAGTIAAFFVYFYILLPAKTGLAPPLNF